MHSDSKQRRSLVALLFAAGRSRLRRVMRNSILTALAVLCCPVTPGIAGDSSQQKFPDVLSAKVRSSGPETFDFDVTLSSPYDTPQRYADAFRVMGKDGIVYGERILRHHHAEEQPFTRDLHAVKIPPSVRMVVVQGRDRRFGYGGRTVELRLPGR